MGCSFINKTSAGLLVGVTLFVASLSSAHAVFINEIHYDNAGVDIGEGVELAGAAGLDLRGWSLVLYNGKASSLSAYSSLTLGGVFADMQNGMGVLDFPIAGMQNGSPDGIALVNAAGGVEQFLSYEGSFMAASGVAAGLTSIDINVLESSATPAGYSLQLLGDGRDYSDFSWALAPAAASFGSINAGQLFTAQPAGVALPASVISVPAPGSLLLLAGGLFTMCLRRASRLSGCFGGGCLLFDFFQKAGKKGCKNAQYQSQ